MDIPYALLWFLFALFLLISTLLTAGAIACTRVTRFALAEALIVADAGDRPTDRARSRRIKMAQKLVQDPGAILGAISSLRGILFLVAGAALTLAIQSHWWQRWPVLLAALLIGVAAAIITALLPARLIKGRTALHAAIALSPLISTALAVTGYQILPQTGYLVGPSDDELQDMIERAGEVNPIEDEERELISAVLELRDTIVREVMVPRTEMATVKSDLPLRKLLRLMLRSGYSRIPVVGESVDDLIGIAYLKDVVQQVDHDVRAADNPVLSVIRKPVFVPEFKPIDDLLREMQAANSHMAIVVDEYGGIAGLVTVEDILEELVGELVDEHDAKQIIPPEEVNPGVWRVPSRMSVDDLGELFNLRLEDSSVDTVGGLLAKAIGQVPIAGSAAEIAGLNLAADRVEGRRRQVATVLVNRVNTQTAAVPIIKTSVVPEGN